MKFITGYDEYLFEGKKEFLLNKYKIENNIFDKLIEADPTKGKYYEWIISRYIKSDNQRVYLEDLYKIKEYLETFELLKTQNKLNKNDINQYKDYKDLYDTISEFGGTGNVSEDEKYLIDDRFYIKNSQAELFYEDDNYLIVTPKTLKVAQFYSNNSQWCTRFPDNFNYYTSEGNLYIIINKSLLNTTDDNRRLQFHFETSSFMNINDKELKFTFKSKFLDIFKSIKSVWKLNYDKIGEYHEGLARVYLNDKIGYVNNEGIEICELKYDEFEQYYDNDGGFEDGFAIVNNNGSYGFINKNGVEICELKYRFVEKFHDGFALVMDFDYKHGFINKDGVEICELKYEFDDDFYPDDISSYYFNDGVCRVVIDNKFGVIDTTGEEIIPCEYYYIEYLNDGVFQCETETGETTYIDKNGNITPENKNKK